MNIMNIRFAQISINNTSLSILFVLSFHFYLFCLSPLQDSNLLAIWTNNTNYLFRSYRKQTKILIFENINQIEAKDKVELNSVYLSALGTGFPYGMFSPPLDFDEIFGENFANKLGEKGLYLFLYRCTRTCTEILHCIYFSINFPALS